MEYKDWKPKKIVNIENRIHHDFCFVFRFLKGPISMQASVFSKAFDYQIKIAQQAANSYRIKYK